jgi:hypothetical protein
MVAGSGTGVSIIANPVRGPTVGTASHVHDDEFNVSVHDMNAPRGSEPLG